MAACGPFPHLFFFFFSFFCLTMAMKATAFGAVPARASSTAEVVNGSSMVWAQQQEDEQKEEVEMNMDMQMENPSQTQEGFSSLTGMLHWAIGHSDPEELKGVAEDLHKWNPVELEKRRTEIKELMESLHMPSDAELMKVAIDDLRNASLTVEYRRRALEELLELVEPIDNANDLNKLGGLSIVVEELDRTEAELRTYAAWVLGKASQNNPTLQDQIRECGALPKLMNMVRSDGIEEAVKALYAVSAVIRNHPHGQESFYVEGGALLLQEIMSNASKDIRLRRKSVALVADLAEQQLQTKTLLEIYEPSESFLKSVVDLVTMPDLDTQEKALVALRSLGQLNKATHEALKDTCQIQEALGKVRSQLKDLMEDDDSEGFAKDMEALRQSVESMFVEQ